MNHPETGMLKVKNKSIYYYNELAKDIMERVKFKGDCRLLDAFKKDVKEFLLSNYPIKDHIIIPTPIPTNRLIERGFNQVTYLLNELHYDIQDIVIKTTSDKQSKKSKQERLKLDRHFSIKQPINEINKHIILVDDLYTTGATIHNIARELVLNGYRGKIDSVTLFRG